MPIIAILTFLLQLVCAVHAVRTGREQFWLYLILFLPGLGCIIYIVTQMLPDLRGSPKAHAAAKSAMRTIDPKRDLRRRLNDLEVSDNVANRLALAEECSHAGMHDEALELLQTCITDDDSPDLLVRLSEAQFNCKRYAETVATLDNLIGRHPNFRSHDGHFLYARALVGLDQFDRAAQEYEAVIQSYPGEEARARFALLLESMQRVERAQFLWQEILTRAKRAPKYYRKAQKQWIDLAEQHLL